MKPGGGGLGGGLVVPPGGWGRHRHPDKSRERAPRPHASRVREEGRGREGVKADPPGAGGWILPLLIDCGKARGWGHCPGPTAGFLCVREPRSVAAAVSRKSRSLPQQRVGALFPPLFSSLSTPSASPAPGKGLEADTLIYSIFFAPQLSSGACLGAVRGLGGVSRAETTGTSARVPSIFPQSVLHGRCSGGMVGVAGAPL